MEYRTRDQHQKPVLSFTSFIWIHSFFHSSSSEVQPLHEEIALHSVLNHKNKLYLDSFFPSFFFQRGPAPSRGDSVTLSSQSQEYSQVPGIHIRGRLLQDLHGTSAWRWAPLLSSTDSFQRSISTPSIGSVCNHPSIYPSIPVRSINLSCLILSYLIFLSMIFQCIYLFGGFSLVVGQRSHECQCQR